MTRRGRVEHYRRLAREAERHIRDLDRVGIPAQWFCAVLFLVLIGLNAWRLATGR